MFRNRGSATPACPRQLPAEWWLESTAAAVASLRCSHLRSSLHIYTFGYFKQIFLLLMPGCEPARACAQHRIMKRGQELSRTVATFIVQKILMADNGLFYICATAERFFAVSFQLLASSP